jgi:carbon storage regulator
MLVLSRKVGESIVVGENVLVTVVAFARNKVRIGITAPRDVGVHREEVWLKIKGEEAEAPAIDGGGEP